MKKIFKNFIFIILLMLLVLPSKCFAMQVFVKLIDGSNITLEVESSDMIEAVKEKIYDKTGIPSSQQILNFGGKNLEDGRSVSDCGIKRDNTIYLFLKLARYNITYNLSNITSSNMDKTVIEEYSTILKANFGYRLPNTITILVGGNNIDSYTYDKESGKVVIDKEVITGDIEITAVGVAEEENPKTFDSIEKSFISSGLSVLGIILVSIYIFSKRGA